MRWISKKMKYGIIPVVSLAVIAVVFPASAQAEPYKNGNFACEKFDTYTVCDTAVGSERPPN